MELTKSISAIMQQFDDGGLIPHGGMVRPEYYDRARELSHHFKQEFVKLAEGEKQKELHGKVWPYQ